MCISGDWSSPNIDPNEDVAHGDEYHGEYVAEDKVTDDKVEDFTDGVGPDIETESNVGVVVEYHYQIEEKDPGSGDTDGEDPDKDDHHSRAALGDLALQGPPNGQESVTKKKYV